MNVTTATDGLAIPGWGAHQELQTQDTGNQPPRMNAKRGVPWRGALSHTDAA